MQLKCDVTKAKLSTRHGSMTLILGPMYSGKTTELFRRYRREKFSGRNCGTVGYKNDTEGKTHDGVDYNFDHECELARSIWDKLIKYDAIFFNEGQFIKDLPKVADELANLGKTVVICALSATSDRTPWEVVSQLIPLCESLVSLDAICLVCGQTAACSRKIAIQKEDTGSVFAMEHEAKGDPREDIGADKYIPTCRVCFTRPLTPNVVSKMTKRQRTYATGLSEPEDQDTDGEPRRKKQKSDPTHDGEELTFPDKTTSSRFVVKTKGNKRDVTGVRVVV